MQKSTTTQRLLPLPDGKANGCILCTCKLQAESVPAGGKAVAVLADGFHGHDEQRLEGGRLHGWPGCCSEQAPIVVCRRPAHAGAASSGELRAHLAQRGSPRARAPASLDSPGARGVAMKALFARVSAALVSRVHIESTAGRWERPKTLQACRPPQQTPFRAAALPDPLPSPWWLTSRQILTMARPRPPPASPRQRAMPPRPNRAMARPRSSLMATPTHTAP